ncbi:MAG: putative sugar nucleotidyl transferase [Gemmatimonadota bacterium]|nr:putative sugar nucleotidyl transferase [Gemmatimonadota bacterium]
MVLYLFDDRQARNWMPFTLTRPAGELMFGCLLLRERAERFWGRPCTGQLVNPSLVGFDEDGAPPIITHVTIGVDEPRVLFSSRAVPAVVDPPCVDDPATLTMNGHTVGWVLPAGTDLPEGVSVLEPETSPPVFPPLELSGQILETPWELMASNGNQIRSDVEDLFPESQFTLADGVHHSGTENISIEPTAHVEAGVYLDVTKGPIRLEDGVRISAFTRLVGPLFIGKDTQILGGTIRNSSIGRTCHVKGEVQNSVLLGYCNKSHDGYLGHSYLGRWVNLGALTTNSDLKNNYSTVRVNTADGPVDTGRIKVGCFLADHVKTGVGTLLPTGCIVGAGSNLFGGLMSSVSVPPFSWGGGESTEEYRINQFLETAEHAMSRRDVALTAGGRAVLLAAWKRTHRGSQ